jgi:parallel beta-helix repeat protein
MGITNMAVPSNAATLYCIDCNNVTIKGLILENNSDAIFLHNTTESIIEDNLIYKSDFGINLTHSTNNTITSNDVINNTQGIYLHESNKNYITKNTIRNNSMNGIYLKESDENDITVNSVNDNGGNGVILDPCEENTVTDNSLNGNGNDDLYFSQDSLNNYAKGNIKYSEFATGEIAVESLKDNKNKETILIDGVSRESRTETESLQSLIDEALMRLPEGKVLFNPASKMKVGQSELIEVLITRNISQNLTEELQGSGEIQNATLKISYQMTAKLKADPQTFKIVPLCEDTQSVPSYGFAEWEWYVTPIVSGKHWLALEVFATIKAGGMEKPSDVRVFKKDIEVDVNPTVGAWNFLTNNWEFIIGTLLIGSGLLGWILKKATSRRKERS